MFVEKRKLQVAKMESLLDRLIRDRTLSDNDLRVILESRDASLAEDLRRAAQETAVSRFGKQVYLRGLIEWSNVCRNDCLYCGIRRSNGKVARYTLTAREIMNNCSRAWDMGLRTFVLQGGENPRGAEDLVEVVAQIRAQWPDVAITLSLGELPFDLYARLRQAGADRFLLRHETATPEHYARLHPAGMTLEHRLECLRELRRLGFQTGMGMMVGSPWQTTENLIADLRLLEDFRPEMIGIGPFIPQKDTPLGEFPAGSPELTLKLYSIVRLMLPDALIPSTTALSTQMAGGRLAGILAGANVIMPNFSPMDRREDYSIYDGKPAADGAETLEKIKEELATAGYSINPVRGDYLQH